MPVSLTHLPFHVLKEILSYLKIEEIAPSYHGVFCRRGYFTLCSLARTCRSISYVAIGVLYEQIEFDFQRRSDIKRAKLLIKLIDEYPCLRNRIQLAQLRSPIHNTLIEEVYSGDYYYDSFLDCLKTSTSLTTIKLRICRPWGGLAVLRKRCKDGFPQVRTLEIEYLDVLLRENEHLCSDQVASVCELPSLQTLTVRAPIRGMSQYGILNGMPRAILAKLNHLNLLHNPVSVSLLRSLLPRAPNLRSLELSVPGRASVKMHELASGRDVLGYNLHDPLCPRFYGKLLKPVAASLDSLAISTLNVHYFYHDGTRIDLSRFISLTRLKLSSILLFGAEKTPASCAWSREIWKCLPPRVETLELVFDGLQGLFWSLADMRMHARSKTFHDIWQQRLNTDHVWWLLELLNKKREVAPSLKSITITEYPLADRDHNWKIIRWRFADHVKAAAGAAGVELDVKLRVPRQFESPEFDVVEVSPHYGVHGTIQYDSKSNELGYEGIPWEDEMEIWENDDMKAEEWYLSDSS